MSVLTHNHELGQRASVESSVCLSQPWSIHRRRHDVPILKVWSDLHNEPGRRSAVIASVTDCEMPKVLSSGIIDNAMSVYEPPSAATHLIEREEERRILYDAILAARFGEGRFVLVQGPAGIGKSVLVGTERERLRATGMTVLTARCSALESTYAFGVVRQLFEVRLRTHSQWLDGSAASSHAAFDTPGEAAAPGSFDDVSHSVLHGLYWLTVNACGEGPLTIVIDDLQWCDGPSLRFLSYLAGRLAGLSLLILVTARTGEQAARESLVAELIHQEHTQVLQLKPLSSPGVVAFLSARLDVPPNGEFAAACEEATQGNPLLLDELSRAMRADGIRADTASPDVVRGLGPRAVSRAGLLRLAQLDEDAVALAQAVAVLGDAADLEVLRRMTGQSADTLEAAARSLVHAQILRTEGPVGFVHPLIRDSIYYELSAVELEARHLKAAQVLLDAGRSSETIAAHTLLLPPSGQRWLVEVLIDSAGVAVRRGAPEIAVSYLRRAVAEPPPSDLELDVVRQLGLAEALVNDPEGATLHLTTAYEKSHEPETRAHVAQVLARMLFFTRPAEEAVAVSRRAQGDLPAQMRDYHDAFTALELYAVSFGAPDDGKALAAAARGSGGHGVGAKMLAAVRAWDRAVTDGSAQECLAQARFALDGGLLVRQDPSFMTHIAAGVLTLADDPGATQVWDRALAEGHNHGSQMTIGGVLLWQGWAWLQRGALTEAEESLRAYLTATERRGGGHEPGAAYGVGFLLRVLVLRGKRDEARRLAAVARQTPPGSDADIQQVRAQAELHLAEHAWRDALDIVDAVPARRRPVANPAWAPWGALKARALGGLGRHDEAVARATDEVTAARTWGSPSALGPSLRALGMALDLAGDADARSVLEQAVAATEGQPPRLEHAASLAALGSVMRRQRQPSQARPHLERAVAMARACGATPLADHAASEFRAAGGGRLSQRGNGVDALTPSERRVAALAAAGRSNNAIAQELFVTPKTVEVHLSNTYRKLGVTSRAGLAGQLPTET